MRTMSPELDHWLAERERAEREIQHATKLWRDKTETPSEQRRTSPEWTRSVELTDAEWRFLWSRFQPVNTPCFGFARRIQTQTTNIMLLSPEQRCWVLALAFKYRRKVYFNPKAGQLDEETFVRIIKQLAVKHP